MFNRYSIVLSEKQKEVKATIFLNSNSLGSVWVPNNTLKTKEDFVDLFTSIGLLIYGQETKAKKKEESDSQIIEAIEAKNRAEQKEIQKEK